MREIMKALLLIYLAAAAAADIRYRRVSGPLALTAAALALPGYLVSWPPDLSRLLGVLPGLGILAVSRLSRQIGSGDGWVMLTAGLYTGFSAALGILMLALLGTFPVALFRLVCRKAGRRDTMPFVPFLLAGYLVWLLASG